MTRVLMLVTNHGSINGEPRTGVWFTEFSEPYQALVDAGVEVVVATPKGGPAPIDPRGYPKAEEMPALHDAMERLNATQPLAKLNEADFDGIFMPGGHGPMFDLATDPDTKAMIAAFWAAGKPVAAVCHGPASLLDVPVDGGTLLKGKRVTGFTKGEDAVDALFEFMPFSLQERMMAEGAEFIEQPPRSVHSETDGLLVTGQNPASATATAEAFLAVLKGISK